MLYLKLLFMGTCFISTSRYPVSFIRLTKTSSNANANSVNSIVVAEPNLIQSLVTFIFNDLKPKYEKWSVSFAFTSIVNSPFLFVEVPITSYWYFYK